MNCYTKFSLGLHLPYFRAQDLYIETELDYVAMAKVGDERSENNVHVGRLYYLYMKVGE